MEGQQINPQGPISEAYKGIQWTTFRAQILSDFYNRSPIDMQCNQSDGSRFPGSWDHMPQPLFPDLPPAIDPNEACTIMEQEGMIGAPIEIKKREEQQEEEGVEDNDEGLVLLGQAISSSLGHENEHGK